MKAFFPSLRLSSVIVVVMLLAMSCQPEKEENENYVIMLSLDGFRWDYPDSIATPNLDFIARNGVKARSLIPCFPSKTFPNHYSMATGLYPDHHGIVLNSFYDPEMGDYYSIMDRESVVNPAFYEGEPIWVTAEKQDLTSASYFWVGSETPVQGLRPTYWKPYDHDFPFEQRIDSVVSWLALPECHRPHLVLWYMHDPDDIGHRAGPFSHELSQTVTYLDSLVGVFLGKISALPHADEIDIIITSDHGMSSVSKERVVVFEDYIDTSWFDIMQGYNPNYVFRAWEEHYTEALQALKSMPHIKIWEHGQLPERLHYGNHPRTLDFIIVADSSWQLAWADDYHGSAGAHGYDNSNTDMHAIFYAMGPSFRENYSHHTFNNIDLYPLIAHILELIPADVDGSLENVRGMLVEE